MNMNMNLNMNMNMNLNLNLNPLQNSDLVHLGKFKFMFKCMFKEATLREMPRCFNGLAPARSERMNLNSSHEA